MTVQDARANTGMMSATLNPDGFLLYLTSLKQLEAIADRLSS